MAASAGSDGEAWSGLELVGSHSRPVKFVAWSQQPIERIPSDHAIVRWTILRLRGRS